MDCSPEPAERYTWAQRGVAPAETHTSAMLRRGAFWRRVLTSATPRAIPVSTYVCTTENNNVSEAQRVEERQQCVCAHYFLFASIFATSASEHCENIKIKGKRGGLYTLELDKIRNIIYLKYLNFKHF